MTGPNLRNKDYLEFDIRVIQPDEGFPEVQMNSPVGEQSGRIRIALPYWENVQEALASASRMSQPWVKQSVALDTLDPISEMGETLFTGLFEGGREILYRRALEVAESEGMGLRLRLQITDPELATLPWEFMYDRRAAMFIGLSTRSSLIRTLPTAYPTLPPSDLSTLKMLVINTTLNGDVYVKEEIERLRNLQDHFPQLEIEVIGSVTDKYDFLESITRYKSHILHIIGTGMVIGQNRQALPIGWQGDLPNTQIEDLDPKHLVPGNQLADILRENPRFRLVTFSAAYTEQLAAEIAVNIPAVVGIRSAMTSRSYITFMEGMYQALLKGQLLDTAITAGRQEIDLKNPGSREWGLPVFYMQAAEGILLVEAPESAKTTEPIGLTPQAPISRSQPPQDPKILRTWQKLTATLEVYERNLLALEEDKTRYGEKTPKFIDDEIEKTNVMIADIKDQMDAIG